MLGSVGRGHWGPLQEGRMTLAGSGCCPVVVGQQWGGEDTGWLLLQPRAQNAHSLHDLQPWLALGTTFPRPSLGGNHTRWASSLQRCPDSLTGPPVQSFCLLGPSPRGCGVWPATCLYGRFHTSESGLSSCGRDSSSQSPKYLWKVCWSLFWSISGSKHTKIKSNKHKASFKTTSVALFGFSP